MPRAIAATVIALLAAFAAAVDGGLAQTPPSLAWAACGGRLQCAAVSVPLDYSLSGGRRIEVALIRQPARDPARRIGVMLTNPGGPGGSGVDFVRAWAGQLGSEIQDRFDIVGFDPRGVGDSTPALDCHDNIQQLAGLDPNPSTPATWAEVQRVTRAFADLCASRASDLLPHLGSLDVVRDMDQIRAALGEQTVTYLGYSYGTVLGALYADRFPDRVRAVVLDGPVDLTRSADDLAATQSLGFEGELTRYLDDCRAAKCALATGGRDPQNAVDTLLTQAGRQPIPSAAADRPAGAGETLLAITAALYSPRSWPGLTRALQQGLNGDGSGLIRIADRYLDRSGSGYANSSEMNAAVNCLDYGGYRDPAHYVALAARLARDAPHFGAASAEANLMCAYWQPTPQPLGVPHAHAAPPILMVAATRDPATPLPWALNLRLQLDTAVLLTREGDGHTSYASGNACIDSVVNAYLVSLALPQDGATCAGGPTPQPPATPLPARVQRDVAPSAATPVAAPAPAAPGPTTARLASTWAVVAALVVLGVLGVGTALLWRRTRRR